MAPSLRPEAALAPPAFRRAAVSSIALQLVAFDSRSHRLVVVDQPAGPGSRWPDGAAAAASAGAVAAINGGFFTPEGAPLGLVIAAGSRRGSWNRGSSLTSGCYLEGPSRAPALARSTAVDPAAPPLSTLLQSGPFLVEDARPVAGLEAGRVRPRSLVAWDGGRCWLIAVTSPCTLASLAEALAGSSPAGWPVRHALNLDGGRSSELWVAATVAGGPVAHRPPLNRPVRNFLVLVPR